mmetsp:Transcript_25206/g.44955  ORF Transcript_25206/g.44955 Transcript_25206/m.44955 type:complete len:259 (+) Transcript_25206:104-880(+)
MQRDQVPLRIRLSVSTGTRDGCSRPNKCIPAPPTPKGQTAQNHGCSCRPWIHHPVNPEHQAVTLHHRRTLSPKTVRANPVGVKDARSFLSVHIPTEEVPTQRQLNVALIKYRSTRAHGQRPSLRIRGHRVRVLNRRCVIRAISTRHPLRRRDAIPKVSTRRGQPYRDRHGRRGFNTILLLQVYPLNHGLNEPGIRCFFSYYQFRIGGHMVDMAITTPVLIREIFQCFRVTVILQKRGRRVWHAGDLSHWDGCAGPGTT